MSDKKLKGLPELFREGARVLHMVGSCHFEETQKFPSNTPLNAEGDCSEGLQARKAHEQMHSSLGGSTLVSVIWDYLSKIWTETNYE